MPSPRSLPLSAQDCAISARIWSPSISSPFSSAISSRSASPSSAMPRCAPCSTTWAQRYSGTVEPQPRLMLKPSGDTPTGTTVAPSSHSTVGRDAIGRAMRAIDDDLQVVEPQAAREAGLRRLDIAAGGVVQARGAAERAGRGEAMADVGSPSAPRSRARSRRSSLKPSGPNSLMPLSSNGLCEAEIITPRSARRLRVSMAIGRRRQRADQRHVHAGADEAGGERRLDHVAGQPRVLADHHAMAMAAAGEQQPGGLAEPERGLGGHRIGVRGAADAVGAEQASRRASSMLRSVFEVCYLVVGMLPACRATEIAKHFAQFTR